MKDQVMSMCSILLIGASTNLLAKVSNTSMESVTKDFIDRDFAFENNLRSFKTEITISAVATPESTKETVSPNTFLMVEFNNG